MIFKIFTGLFLLITGLVAMGVSIPSSNVIIGVCALIGGIALLLSF